MKYENLNKEELVQKINEFESELKGYVNRVDQRYKVFFERNLAGIYRTRLNGDVLDCNDAMAQILGYDSKDELIGQNAKLLYMNVEDRTKHLDILKKNGFVKNQKLELKRKDGSQIWVSISTTEIENPRTKKVEYLEGTMIDITELIYTQEKLISSEENIKRMLDESPYAILIHEKGILHYRNKRCEEIMEISLNTGESIKSIFPRKLVSHKFKATDSIDHFDRVEINVNNSTAYLDVYVKQVTYDHRTMVEFSFVDIRDRIELEEEKIKTNVFKNLNDNLKKEIREKEKVEKELITSLKTNMVQSAKMAAIFENSSHVIWTMDKEFRLTSFNSNLTDLFSVIYGIKPKVNDIPFEDFEKLQGEERELWLEAHKKAFKGEALNFVSESKNPDGEPIFMNVFLNPIYDDKEEVTEVSGIGHDITDQVITESKLTESLKEKEVLIKEIHHRVKNNLQVISSIFNLQSAFIDDSKIKEVLRESQNRIKSMAYIHESLYKSSQLGQIDFEAYVQELAKNLIHSYAHKESKVSLLTETESVQLDLDVAIPCGLIVNEIVSNSLKHGFTDQQNGIIAIFLQNSNNKVKLKLTDDGIGIPDDVLWNESNTLGIQLIQTLVEQIKGDIKVDGSNGTSIEIDFPLN